MPSERLAFYKGFFRKLDWLKSGLFWRTFLLLAILVMTSMAAWFASFRMVERTPKAYQIAAQIVSIVTITRAALTHSAPEKQRELLFDLASNDGIRVYTLEETDQIEPPDETPIFEELKATVQHRLGKKTRFAQKLNGVSDFWVSFDIQEDEYWLRLDQGRLEPPIGAQLLSWASMTLLLTLIGAMVISTLINAPLARLSAAARQIAQGKFPAPLIEKGPKEIRETNASFNQMVDDLARIESDRAVILAGISHDLRTPLARMQLEIEMASLSDDARVGMQSDIEQMDAIIGQFLDYAKPQSDVVFELVDLTFLLEQVIAPASRQANLVIQSSIAANIHINGNAIELKRLFNNLIENSRRYGTTQDTGVCHLDVTCAKVQGDRNSDVIIQLRDHGMGVNEDDLERLLRPFTRADVSRGQANGSGLGLAIVDRIVKRHGGKFRIANHPDGGFLAEIIL